MEDVVFEIGTELGEKGTKALSSAGVPAPVGC
jgi:hypothetical protein